MVVRATGSDKEMTFDVGEPGVGGGPGGGGSISFSDDSKWVGFMTYPKRADAQRLRRQRRPVQNGVTIVNLASGEKHEYQKGRRFAFSGESSAWIALARYAPPASGGRGGAPAGGRGGGPGVQGVRKADRAIGRAAPT